MRNRLLIIAAFITLLPISAGSKDTGPAPDSPLPLPKNGALKRDRFEPDKRWNFIDPSTGARTGGYIKKDRWQDDRYNIYDRHGRQKGIIEQDTWEEDRWNLREDEYGR